MAKNFNLKKPKKVKHKLGRKINETADKIMAREPLKIRNLRKFAQQHTLLLVATFILFVAVTGGIIGVVNFSTAYEYSYSGKTLGVVKDKDEVLRITALVSDALSEDKDVEVVIDKEEDITFKKVSIIGKDIHIDTSEDVLRKMTYVGDINVNGYGITVDGETAVILDSKETAKNVIDTVKTGYLQSGDEAILEDADFVEEVDIIEINTDLDNLSSEKEAVQTLKTGGEEQSIHTVKKGESVKSIAKKYGMTEDKLIQMNPSLQTEKIKADMDLVVVSEAPLVTLEAVQLITYEEKIPYEIEETKTSKMYKGDEKITQKGKYGIRMVTARVESTNGEITTTTPIVENVESQPVTQKVLVGTTKRPPSIGDGKFIWPARPGTYRISSEYGWRWGRLHAGIDMACPIGTDVLAADGGVVVKAQRHPTYGNLVVIDHQNGYQTYYAHNSKLLVSVGDKVYEGYHIAESGNTGRSTGPHIHFEIHVGGTTKNPRGYLP